MKASFLISAPAYSRLAPAASERGWRSDPDYARRTVDRLIRTRVRGTSSTVGHSRTSRR